MKFDPELAAQEYFAKHAAECEIVGCTPAYSPNYYFFQSLAVPAVIVLALYCAHRFGWAVRLRDFLERRIKWSALRPSVFAACLAAYLWLAVLPIRFYQQVILLYRGGGTQVTIKPANGQAPFDPIGFTEQVWNWAERYFFYGIGWAIAAAILLPLALLIIRLLPRIYWAIAALGFAAFSVISYTDTPYVDRYVLPDGELKSDIEVMAQAAGVPIDRVYIGKQELFFGSRLYAHANWVDGAQRVIIGEHLLNTLQFSPAVFSPAFEPITAAEVRAIAGHELAHVQHNHFFWLNGIATALILLMGWLASLAIRRIVRRKPDLRSVGDLSTVPAIGITCSLVIFAQIIVMTNIHRIAEDQADATGLDLARDPDGFAQLAMRIHRTAPLSRDYFAQKLVVTHPDVKTRIRRAMDWKATNTPANWQSEGLSGPIRVRCSNDRMVVLSNSDHTRRNVCTIDWEDEDIEP